MSVIVSGTDPATRLAAMLRLCIRAADLIEANPVDVAEMQMVVMELEAPPPQLQTVREEVYREIVAFFVKSNRGNVSAAAEEAGMDRKAFHDYVQRFCIDPNQFRVLGTRERLAKALVKRRATEAAKHALGG